MMSLSVIVDFLVYPGFFSKQGVVKESPERYKNSLKAEFRAFVS